MIHLDTVDFFFNLKLLPMGCKHIILTGIKAIQFVNNFLGAYSIYCTRLTVFNKMGATEWIECASRWESIVLIHTTGAAVHYLPKQPYISFEIWTNLISQVLKYMYRTLKDWSESIQSL